MENIKASVRRYDLDWLRVIAFSLLIFYHTGLGYNAGEPWYMKNPETTTAFRYWISFLNHWRMPLLFCISGAGVWFSLNRRSPGQFAKERITRLLIPFLFGVLFIVPPQIYLERLLEGVHYNNYWQFQWTVFKFKFYPEGNFSWHHLWYLPYVLSFSLLGIPFFLFWRSGRAAKTRDRLQAFFAHYPLAFYLVFLLPGISNVILQPIFPTTFDLVHDWANFTSSFIFFLLGFILASHQGFSQTINQNLHLWLGASFAAIIMVALLFILQRFHGLDWFPASVSHHLAFRRLLNTGFTWACLMLLFALAYRYLNFNSYFLQYANQAVFPFYILHQTFIVLFIYVMRPWHANVLVKFGLTVSGTFGMSFLLYEYIIRRVRLLHPFFGLKWQSKSKKGTPQETTADVKQLEIQNPDG